MPIYAKIENDVVTQVVVAAPNVAATFAGEWVRTDATARMGMSSDPDEPTRGNYAGIGYTYDRAIDAFLPPKPFESWTLDKDMFVWQPPVPQTNPTDVWNETDQVWVLSGK